MARFNYIQSNQEQPYLIDKPPDNRSNLPRAIAAGASIASLYQSHKWALRNRPDYARKLYKAALDFEELTPWNIGTTFGLSERFSSYLIDEVRIPARDLHGYGTFSPLGSHLDRLGVDVTGAGSELRFLRRTADDPYLYLEGTDVGVRYVKSYPGRYSASSSRYKASLDPAKLELNFSGEFWKPSRIAANIRALKESQIPKSMTSGIKVPGLEFNVSPYLSKFGAPLVEDFSTGNIVRNVESYTGRIGRVLFENMERLQKLMADTGFGLRAGSYNKLAHVPFIGSGGIINELLSKRIAPIAIGATALGFADYLTGHTVSDALISAPLKANVLRADLTDSIPGARSTTDLYANVVPGAQYGPLAMPLGGLFIGAAYHYSKVLSYHGTGRYPKEARDLGGALLARVGEDAGFKIGELFTTSGLKRLFTGKGRYPLKGLIAGLGLMLPFVPGMLGSRRTGDELREIYSGQEPVPVKSGRWWDLGTSPFEGGRIKEYRPHWYQVFKNRSEVIANYGSEAAYWENNPILHPFKYLKDPYFLEKRNYGDRPYPVASPAFSNVPLIGPLLAATIGKLVKPPVIMHEGEWSEDNYNLYSNRLEPGRGGLMPAKPGTEFGLVSALKAEAIQYSEWIGLPGFIARSAYDTILPDNQIGQNVLLQGSRQIDNWSRRYYEKELGAGLGPSIDADSTFGYSEPLRRFIQREMIYTQLNDIPNTMPGWLPSDDYFINFRVGDPYTKISDGFARLPGPGYASLHPSVEGLDPADYPDIEKLRILGDVAPYSKEYAGLRSHLDIISRDNTELRIDYDKIVDRVNKMKESVVHTDERRFTGKTEYVEGTITQASPYGISLEEYPGRTFTLSALGFNAADLSSISLGQQNDQTRSQLASSIEQKRLELEQYISQTLSSGTQVKLTVPYGAIDRSEKIRAVVEANGVNVNRELIAKDLAVLRKDAGGPEAGSIYSGFGRTIGALAESFSFSGDNEVYEPNRFLPNPANTKLWQSRTAVAKYISEEVVGTRMRRWNRPIHDFLGPYFRGMVKRLTGSEIFPEGVMEKRKLNTLTDMLEYLRALHGAAVDPESSGRYTNQASRTSEGSNLFGSTSFIASTLPDREPAYFRKFVTETNPEARQKILEVASPELARALVAQWAGQRARIAEAEGQQVGQIQEGGRLLTREDIDEYSKAGTALDYGNYLRSKEIAEFFYRNDLNLPDMDSAIWDNVVDYEDVKLKIIQNEGYDMHDFNIFEDRAAMLWRKPWLDGSARELTSGNTRSVDNLRQAVEQLMIAAGNRNPDVRSIGPYSHRPIGNINMDVEIDDDDEVLRELRRNPEVYDTQ